MPARATKSTAPKTASSDQDKPFVFKSKTGSTITIPGGTDFDPDADTMVAMRDAQRDHGDGLEALAATIDMIRSGFPAEIAEQIKLKTSEVETFSRAYFKFAGVDLPK
ncbi:hypothetical protein [Zhihengliuella halotolerans]|uniref:hypothetical protein n=1 Tax=Zhihengliuella halotolerans TaxID=370736 RepID=UPI000C80F140|nr:hypothetical protein [Zhihengliuella halotolerans]